MTSAQVRHNLLYKCHLQPQKAHAMLCRGYYVRVLSSLQDGSPFNDNFGAQESCQEKVRCPQHHLTLSCRLYPIL